MACYVQTSIKTDGFRSLAEGEAVEFHVEVSCYVLTCSNDDVKPTFLVSGPLQSLI